jgi:hypothetical protein
MAATFSSAVFTVALDTSLAWFVMRASSARRGLFLKEICTAMSID